MEELKNDSKFVLRLILLMGGVAIIMSSKIFIYFVFLSSMAVNGYFLSKAQNISFLDNFTISTVLGSLLFEIFYPNVFRNLESGRDEIKQDFLNARNELRRRKKKSDNL